MPKDLLQHMGTSLYDTGVGRKGVMLFVDEHNLGRDAVSSFGACKKFVTVNANLHMKIFSYKYAKKDLPRKDAEDIPWRKRLVHERSVSSSL